MADRFPFMRVYMEVAEQLKKDDRAYYYDALIHYALDDQEPSQSVGGAVFYGVKRMVDKWKQTSEAERKRAASAGRSLDGRWNPAGDSLAAKTQQKNKSIKDKKNKSIKDNNTPAERRREIAQKVLDLYNRQCPSMPRATKLTDQRVSHVNARLSDHTLEEVADVFRRAEASEFLSGRSSKWRADFDWLTNENNMVKVLEGRYDDRKSGNEDLELRKVEEGRKAQEEAESRIEAEHRAEIEKLRAENPEEWARIQEKAKRITSIKEVLHELC